MPEHRNRADVVVAASDASQRMKNQADYVADGDADEVEIQAATVNGGVIMALPQFW
jgi:hypothetical protein